MYECPDIFELPVDGNTNNMMWELNDGSSGYQLGQFNGSIFTPTTAELPGNLGSGYYASQTFTSMAPGDNRKVRIGWAQISTPGMPFNQLMYFPTALSLQTTGQRRVALFQGQFRKSPIECQSMFMLGQTPALSPGYNPLVRHSRDRCLI